MAEQNDSMAAQRMAADRLSSLSEEDLQLLREADEQYVGTYTYSADSKWRIVIPQTFRTMLGDKFYVAPNYDFTAVALYTKLAWSRTRKRYASLDPVNPTMQLYLDSFNALSYSDQECDGQGRLLLPPRIRKALLDENEKEMEISGAGDHVNIMCASAYAMKFQQMMNDMPEIKKTINLLRARGLGAAGLEAGGRNQP